MKPRLVHAFLALLFTSLLVRADDFEARSYSAPDGSKLAYRLLKPLNYQANQKYPLVVFLHGAGERGDDNNAQLKNGVGLFTRPEVREKFPCFVLAPQCPLEKKWVEMDWAGDSGTAPEVASPNASLVLAVVGKLVEDFSIDVDRLYLTGLSMGGYGTWDLITRLPEKWAAAAPVCGGGDKTKAAQAKPVPTWAFHGSADAVVKPIRSEQMVEALKAAGGSVAYTCYPGVGHNSWDLAYAEPNLLPWMFAQRRGQPAKMDLAVGPYTALAMPPESVFPGQGPLQLADWFQKLWMARRVDFAKSKEQDQGAIVCLGDSITQGWGGLAADFPNLKIVNRGISGDTSRGVRYRLPGDVLELHPKAVSLLVGTNDLSMGGAPEVIVDNIRAIIAELQKQNPSVPIILNHVMPRAPQPGLFPEKIQKLNAMLDELARNDPRLTICDTWGIFADDTSAPKKEEFPDTVHPNAAGYAKWKAALNEVFARLKL